MVEIVKIIANKLEESQGGELKRELEKHSGISKANIAGEAITVFYAMNEVSEKEILRTIERQTGCWAEIIKEKQPEKRDSRESSREPVVPAGFTLFSMILNIVLIIIIFRLTGSRSQNPIAAPSVNGAATVSESAVSSPTIEQFNITKDNHIRGSFDAPITLVEFSDFECPFCGKIEPTLQKILKDYDSKVRLVYKHFPLSIHPNGEKAAESSECADEQDKFWEYHDKLFVEQPNGFSVDKFKTWAKELNLKEDQFNDCLDSGKYAEKVGADAAEGEQKRVDGTPATYVNGKLVSGAVSYDEFRKVIESNIK